MMSNYPANTKKWKRGDIVIHDADQKHPKMLMVVRGYDKLSGLCKTQYVDVFRRQRILMRNDIKYLHPPSDFGINPDWATYSQYDFNVVILNWDKMHNWNSLHPVGSTVYVSWADGNFYAKTRSLARINNNGEAYIELVGKAGYWLLYKIIPAENFNRTE